MRDVVIVSGARTPVGAFGGTLKSTPTVQLGALVLNETLKKVGLRPVTTDSLRQFDPNALKGKGMVELEKEAYDYDDTLQPVQIDDQDGVAWSQLADLHEREGNWEQAAAALERSFATISDPHQLSDIKYRLAGNLLRRPD